MIPPEEFALMVSEDIKGKADAHTQQVLRSKAHREMWRKNLIEIIETVNSQIDDMQKEMDRLRSIYEDEFFSVDPTESIQARAEKARRFKFHAEKRLGEADRIIAMDIESPDMRMSAFLRDVINHHKKLKEESGNFDDTDVALWQSLSGNWGF